MTTGILGGTIVTDTDVFRGNILIEDGRILEIDQNERACFSRSADGIIDASGKIVLPGAVDIHTHMDLDVGIARAVDDFYSGTVAAACGGTTTIVDHMAFGPKGCSPWHQVKEYHRLADGNAVVDYGFHGVLQHVDDDALDGMAQIAEEEGITSFKIYMTYDFRLDDTDL
ncbi:MAG: amidohydrolase family protein, partial [Clostridia bacterium]|nr:amidohydrolase family protein [Clostridia bacterium]